MKQITNFHIISSPLAVCTFFQPLPWYLYRPLFYSSFRRFKISLTLHDQFLSASLWFYESQFYFYITLFSIRAVGVYLSLSVCVLCMFSFLFGAVAFSNDVAKLTIVAIHLIAIHFHFTNELEYLNSFDSPIQCGPNI